MNKIERLKEGILVFTIWQTIFHEWLKLNTENNSFKKKIKELEEKIRCCKLEHKLKMQTRHENISNRGKEIVELKQKINSLKKKIKELKNAK